MKTLILCILTFLPSLSVNASQEAQPDKPAASIESGANQEIPSPAKPAAAPEEEYKFTDADYIWLGKLVWNKLRPNIDPKKPELAQYEIDNLVTNMEKNGGRIDLTLDELTALMNSRALGCGGPNSFFGLDLNKIKF